MSANAEHREIVRVLRNGDLTGADARCLRLISQFPDFLSGW